MAVTPKTMTVNITPTLTPETQLALAKAGLESARKAFNEAKAKHMSNMDAEHNAKMACMDSDKAFREATNDLAIMETLYRLLGGTHAQ